MPTVQQANLGGAVRLRPGTLVLGVVVMLTHVLLATAAAQICPLDDYRSGKIEEGASVHTYNNALVAGAETAAGQRLIVGGNEMVIVGLKRYTPWFGKATLRAAAVYGGGVRILISCDEISSGTVRAGFPDLRLGTPKGVFVSYDNVTQSPVPQGVTNHYNGMTVYYSSTNVVITSPRYTYLCQPGLNLPYQTRSRVHFSAHFSFHPSDYYINLNFTRNGWFFDGNYPVMATPGELGFFDGNLNTFASVLNYETRPVIQSIDYDLFPRTDVPWTFSASATSTPAYTSVKYAWDTDGDGVYNNSFGGGFSEEFYATPGVKTIGLIVSNSLGFATATNFQICVADSELDRYAYELGGGVTGTLLFAEQPPADGTNSFTGSPGTGSTLVVHAHGTEFAINPEYAQTYVATSGKVTALDFSVTGTNAERLTFHPDNAYAYTNPVSFLSATGAYTLTHVPNYLVRTLILQGDLEGVVKVRVPLYAADGTRSFYCEGEPATLVSVTTGTNTFTALPQEGDQLTITSNRISALSLTLAGTGQLVLHPDGTFAWVDGVTTNGSGTYALSALDDYVFDAFTTNGMTVGVQSLDGLTYALEGGPDPDGFVPHGNPIPGDGSTILFEPPMTNNHYLMRVRAE